MQENVTSAYVFPTGFRRTGNHNQPDNQRGELWSSHGFATTVWGSAGPMIADLAQKLSIDQSEYYEFCSDIINDTTI
jgi:hypothetical protein